MTTWVSSGEVERGGGRLVSVSSAHSESDTGGGRDGDRRFQRGREYDFVTTRGRLREGEYSGMRTHSLSKRTIRQSFSDAEEVPRGSMNTTDVDVEAMCSESSRLCDVQTGVGREKGRMGGKEERS